MVSDIVVVGNVTPSWRKWYHQQNIEGLIHTRTRDTVHRDFSHFDGSSINHSQWHRMKLGV